MKEVENNINSEQREPRILPRTAVEQWKVVQTVNQSHSQCLGDTHQHVSVNKQVSYAPVPRVRIM